MIRRKDPAMPTPPRTYSSAAAEKLRLALLALAASAAVVASAQDVPDDDPADTDVLGEIPEDIEEGGVYATMPCEKKSCQSEECWCEDNCTEEKPCTDCDTQGEGEENDFDGEETKSESHAENAEAKTHAENAESAETESHAENAESAESESHAESSATTML